MSISVVIPAYNAAVFLEQTVRSVQAQTLPDWEMVIVDDGSLDDTRAVAEALAHADPRIRVVWQPNQGVAAARNCGGRESQASRPYLLFLDHDDVLMPDAMIELRELLDRSPRAPAAAGAMRFVDASGAPVDRPDWRPRPRRLKQGKEVEWTDISRIPFEVLVYRNCIWSPGQVLYRREAWESAGGFYVSAAPCDDWDLNIRLSRQGAIAQSAKVVLLSRQHGGNLSSDTELMSEAARRVLRQVAHLRDLSADEKDAVCAAIRAWEREEAAQRASWARELLASNHPFAAALQIRHALLASLRARSASG